MLCFTGGTRLSANLIDKQVAAFKDPKGTGREGTTRLKTLAFEAKSLLLRGKILEFGLGSPGDGIEATDTPNSEQT